MSYQDIYQEALHFIEGSGGYPKDEKKGYKKMKEAADAGSTKASAVYAVHLFEQKKYSDALNYFEKNNAYKEKPRTYVTCLYNCALKKADEQILKSYYQNALRVYDDLHGDSYYYFAQLAQASGADDAVYRKALYYAALGNSQAMPDDEYKLIGRERGVVFGKGEISAYIDVNYSGKDAEYFGGFLPCAHDEQSAWNVAKANLSDRKIKKAFSASTASALRKAMPKGILEYQPVVYSAISVGTISYKFKHDSPKYSTVTTGSGSLQIDRYWYNYHAAFRSKYRQGDFHKQFEKATFTKTVPDARMRTSTPRWEEVVDASFNMAKSSATSGARSRAESNISSKYNWEERYVTATLTDGDQSVKALKTYYVPFWFFTVNFAFGKSATARVNGATGEVEFFENNPFGLFTPYDDVTCGAYQLYSKERQKAMKKASPEHKKRKKHLIILAVHALVFLIAGLASQGLLAVLTIASLIIFCVAWLRRKGKTKKLKKCKTPSPETKAETKTKETKAEETKTEKTTSTTESAKKTEQTNNTTETTAKTEEVKPESNTLASPTTDDNDDEDDDGEDNTVDSDDDIITLLNAEGEEVDFVEIAGIAYNDNFYAILQPVELTEGMDEDEALVFKVTKKADGSDSFEIELDDAIIDAVFAEYNKLLDEAK